MTGFILRRFLISIPLVIVASFVVFVLASLGDPLAELRMNPNVSEATIRVREAQLNLDRPIPVRYGLWISDAARGDLGRSSQTNEPVWDILKRRIPVTLRLVVAASILAALIGMAVGVVAAVRQYSKFDYGATFAAFVFFSMPVFWLAAVLKDVGIRINQAVGRRIFFTVGEATPGLDAGFIGTWMDRLGHMLLPATALILIQMAALSRFQRASMLDVINSDYIRTARAKGLSEGRVIVVHAMRNALIPVTTLLAIDFGAIIGGAIITETIFSWRGMGVLFLDAVAHRDVNVIQGWLLVTAISVIVFNLIADILYGVLDPRIRRG